ncbi:MAG: type II toxin-antitoxin system VapC family toxin [Candidatus Acidiferrum sp.]
MRVLIDTVTFIWAVRDPQYVSRPAMSMLANEATLAELSAISISEIAVKQAIGKLTFSKEDVAKSIASLKLRVLSYTAEHSYKLFELPLHHTDPFDRQIIAQAMAEEIPVMTSDRIFGAYQGLKIIW